MGFRSPLTTTIQSDEHRAAHGINLRPKGLLSGKEAETWTSSSASREKNPGRQLLSPASVDELTHCCSCMFERKGKNSRGKQLSAPYDGLDLIGIVSAF